jgi:hypothetical protein
MSTDEAEIMDFLKQNPEIWFTRKEISKKAKRRDEYEENPHWASAPLHSLMTQKLIMQNESGAYRLQEDEDRKKYLW